MRIYIIRHGETESNEEGRLQGWKDDPLNALGVRLAEETGKALTGTRFDAVYSSPLLRARQTAEIILRESENKAELRMDDRIKEIHMGDYEGKRFKPGQCEVDPALIAAFFADPVSSPGFPGGESVPEVMVRTQAFLKELARSEYETVLVSTHGCALRCMLNFLYADPADFWHGHVPYNCCINIVETNGDMLRLAGDDLILYDPALQVDRYAFR